MNLSYDQIVQLTAWFLTLVELILALYILFLNPRHRANLHVGILLIFFAVNTYAVGLLVGPADTSWISLPLSAATSPAMQPALLLVSVVLVKPGWLTGRWRWVWWPVYGLVLLPLVLTVIDAVWGIGLWYTGVDAQQYAGGFLSLSDIANGSLAPPLRALSIYLMGMAPAVVLLYVVLLDRKVTPLNRRLAWLLLAAQISAMVFQFWLRDIIGADIAALVTGIVFVLVYAYAGFQQMVSERRVRRGRLQSYLTILMLIITLPILVAVSLLTAQGTLAVVAENADERLSSTGRSLESNVDLWLDLNVRALQQMAMLPEIVSMDPVQQKPVLESMVESYPHLSLVSTMDVDGLNVARSDDLPAENYRSEYWHIGARNGVPITFDVVVDEERGLPVLVMAVPVRRELGTIVGVAMFASDLTAITEEVKASQVGEEGFAYVVDGRNRVVAHPDAAYAAELRDLNYYEPVFALRGGARGLLDFTDEEGQAWRAYVDEMSNGWGVLVQQPADELRAPVRQLQAISWTVVAVGAVLLLLLVWLTVRQSLRPIGTLTDTATAIAAGDLSRVAPVESEDEVGALARSFNSMTEQLRGLIGSLETQVADRTRDLEQRSAYLEATAVVGRAAASILDTDELVQQVVELIRERFDLYYVGLFLVGAAGGGDGAEEEWAGLRAGAGGAGGRAGEVLMARRHRIRVGEGMIGWSIAHAQPRVALEAEADAVRLATPELPDTRSEAALPLRSRGRVLGALSVQHSRVGVFDAETMSVLQTMADQVAVALDNARLFAESQASIEAIQRAYGQLSRQAWEELLQPRGEWGYRYTRGAADETTAEAGSTVTPTSGDWHPEMLEAWQTGRTVGLTVGLTRVGAGNGGADARSGRDQGAAAQVPDGNGARETMAVPLRVRDQVIGALRFSKGPEGGDWTEEERALLEAFAAQLEVALDSARLYQDTQRRAAQEQLVGQVTARMRESLDVEKVLKTASEELYQALGLEELVISLNPVSGTTAEFGNGLSE